MTADEWLEMVEWVQDRLPGWDVARAAAYGRDLRDYDAADVWDALFRMYDRGIDYAPTGSKLKVEVTEVVRERLRKAQLEARGLPENAGEDLTWKTWGPKLGFEDLEDAIAAAHERIFANGCPYPGCDLCGNILASVSQDVT